MSSRLYLAAQAIKGLLDTQLAAWSVTADTEVVFAIHDEQLEKLPEGTKIFIQPQPRLIPTLTARGSSVTASNIEYDAAVDILVRHKFAGEDREDGRPKTSKVAELVYLIERINGYFTQLVVTDGT